MGFVTLRYPKIIYVSFIPERFANFVAIFTCCGVARMDIDQ